MRQHAIITFLLLSVLANAQKVVSSYPDIPRQSIGKIFNYVGPWKKDITATVFWIGEKPSGANKTPNHKSSWDVNWAKNYGGYDNPDPAARTGYRPKAFIPKQNPFYIALPYNDLVNHYTSKPEVSKIPWHKYHFLRPGRTILKGTWVQIVHEGKSCYAQWEDCGPWGTDDFGYVFGNKRPKTKKNNSAGIDISPAVRDYLGLKSGEKCHWRFVPFHRIPAGPWRLYGTNNPFRNKAVIPVIKPRK